MWGGWEVSWKVPIRNLAHQPIQDDEKITLELREVRIL